MSLYCMHSLPVLSEQHATILVPQSLCNQRALLQTSKGRPAAQLPHLDTQELGVGQQVLAFAHIRVVLHRGYCSRAYSASHHNRQ